MLCSELDSFFRRQCRVVCSETYPAKCSGQVKGILKNPLFEPNCIYFLRKKNPDDFEIDVNCNEGAFFTKLQRNACGPALEVSKRHIILNKVIMSESSRENLTSFQDFANFFGISAILTDRENISD